MKKIKGFMLAAAAGMLLMAACTNGQPDTADTSVDNTAAQQAPVFETEEIGVKVTLSVDKAAYDMGDEVHYTLVLSNTRERYKITQMYLDYSSISDALKPTADTEWPDHLAPLLSGESHTLTGTLKADETVTGKAEPWYKGLLSGFEPIYAEAAGTVNQTTLRPYVQFDYAGQQMMVRFVIKISAVQENPDIPAENRVRYKTVSVHDPSIFKDRDGSYYIFGTHLGLAKSEDLTNWTDMTDSFRKSFTEEEKALIRSYNRDQNSGSWFGYLWAPDVVYNPVMEKYCMYLSANGDDWVSNIVLLTADKAEGPYSYAGTVVYGGFTEDNYAQTDVERVTGSSNVPLRYITNGVANRKWGDEYPNCIDPCVFYDEEGNLRMSYGSWSGGIFMLELDEETGLRDYDVTYDTDPHSDAYFGTKIAGGKYVSGEGSYIQHIGDHYYLFMSYGNLEAKGGYNIRVFRSSRPDGDYVDELGNSALYDEYIFNYNESRGVRLFGGYQDSYMNRAQVAQGHNSAFVDDDGRIFMIFHTRTSDGSEMHYVKVHQLFMNEDGWLVAAPYQTNGEKLGAVDEITGRYEVIFHKLGIDFKTYGVNTPEEMNLNADGTVSGAYSGTWSVDEAHGRITLSVDGQTYHGVILRQMIEGTDIETTVFTVLGTENQLTFWGSRSIEQ